MIATTMPISTKNTIATCIQIQVGDMPADRVVHATRPTGEPRDTRGYAVGMPGRQSEARPQRTSRLALLGLAALALALWAVAWVAPSGASSGSAHAAQSLEPPLGGVNIAGVSSQAPLALADKEIALAQTLHAKLVRTEIAWTTLEPNGPNQIEPRALAFTDRLMQDAASHGIRVVATVDQTPCWASSAPPALLGKCSPEGRSQANVWPPREASAYAAFVGYLARRYGTTLAAIEVWNEPDQANQDYLAGPEKPQHYAAILRAAYPAIKEANPNVLVLAGSLVGSNGVFLQDLYNAGIKGYYDGLAVHFYTLTLASLRAIHETQLKNGDHTPLWLDEFGWSSCWPKRKIEQEQGCVTKQTQALNDLNIFRSLAHTSYVAAEVVYKLQDSTSESFGAVSEGGAHKPAFAALSTVFASPFGRPSPVTLSVHRRHGRLVASGSGPVGDYMRLEVLRGKVLRYKAFFTLNRFNRYSVSLPKVLGTSGLKVRVFQYWAGSARAAQKPA